jgi:hypothetical protein
MTESEEFIKMLTEVAGEIDFYLNGKVAGAARKYAFGLFVIPFGSAEEERPTQFISNGMNIKQAFHLIRQLKKQEKDAEIKPSSDA